MAYGDTFTNAYTLTFSPATGLVVGNTNLGSTIVESPNEVAGSGSTLNVDTTLSASGTVGYMGTAAVGGQFAGIVVYNSSTNTEYLLTNSNLMSGTGVNVDEASDPTPGGQADFDLLTDMPVCFMAGTGIRTPSGDVAIETLSAGDQVVLSNGNIVPVVWVGRQTVVTRFADPVRALPIRIKADAIAPSQPARDVLVSPAHAILVDGVLVQAGALVNGLSIVRETNVPARFSYFHVEVAEHALLLAEGLAAESFVHNAEDGRFDNWADRADVVIPEMDLPLAKSARQVPAAIQARLSARASELFGSDLSVAA